MAPPRRTKLNMDFDAGRFISSRAQAEYEKLREKSICKERGFMPSLQDGELVAMIEERGWQLFCAQPGPVPMGVVKEFYANARIQMNGYSSVRGIRVDYQPQAIRELFSQPPQPQGVEDWMTRAHEGLDLQTIIAELCVPGTGWKNRVGSDEPLSFLAKHLNRYARAWNLFICANLMPTVRTHEINIERATLLWGILKDEYIDLGLLLHQSMLRYMQGGTTGSVPHAFVVTLLCRAAGITWGLEEQIQHPMTPITSATIAQMAEWPGGTPHHRGLGYILQDDEEADAEGTDDEHMDEPPSPSRQQRASRGSRVARAGPSRVRTVMTGSQHRRLRRQVDCVNDRTARFATDMISVLDGMFADMGFQPNWPTYGAHHPYPVPDSPPEEGDPSDD